MSEVPADALPEAGDGPLSGLLVLDRRHAPPPRFGEHTAAVRAEVQQPAAGEAPGDAPVETPDETPGETPGAQG